MSISAPSCRSRQEGEIIDVYQSKPFAIFSGNANRDLAQSLCHHLGQPLGSAKVERFADGEIYVEINQNVRGVN
jgi:ribose-phosphate pyrophosphokinase